MIYAKLSESKENKVSCLLILYNKMRNLMKLRSRKDYVACFCVLICTYIHMYIRALILCALIL